MVPASQSKFYLTNVEHATSQHHSPPPASEEKRGDVESLSQQIIARMLLVFSIILPTWRAQLETLLCGPSADKHDLIDLTVHYLDLI